MPQNQLISPAALQTTCYGWSEGLLDTVIWISESVGRGAMYWNTYLLIRWDRVSVHVVFITVVCSVFVFPNIKDLDTSDYPETSQRLTPKLSTKECNKMCKRHNTI